MSHPSFSDDVVQLIKCLYTWDVRYLIVGGEAVIYYGYPRLTGDVDFFIEATTSNSEKLITALGEFWDGSIPGNITVADFMSPGSVIQFGVVPNRIDILNSISGVDFKNAWENKKLEYLTVQDKKNPIYFIGLSDLIQNKESTARNKDLDDLRYLKKIANKG